MCKMENFPSSNNTQKEELLAKISDKKSELERLEKLLAPFENELIKALESEIVEVQELTALYKKIQKEKKQKRLLQKQKGKNYIPQETVVPIPSYKEAASDYEKKQRKSLYREAMIYVHPDKFSLESDQKDLATDAASQLIELYNNGSLEELMAFHAYVMSGNLVEFDSVPVSKLDIDPNEYLEIQFQKITLELRAFKKKQTYIVMTTYDNPMDFLEELKMYYADRIFKLRKRTRKARK